MAVGQCNLHMFNTPLVKIPFKKILRGGYLEDLVNTKLYKD
jgi:hypothetical protein